MGCYDVILILNYLFLFIDIYLFIDSSAFLGGENINKVVMVVIHNDVCNAEDHPITVSYHLMSTLSCRSMAAASDHPTSTMQA